MFLLLFSQCHNFTLDVSCVLTPLLFFHLSCAILSPESRLFCSRAADKSPDRRLNLSFDPSHEGSLGRNQHRYSLTSCPVHAAMTERPLLKLASQKAA